MFGLSSKKEMRLNIFRFDLIFGWLLFFGSRYALPIVLCVGSRHDHRAAILHTKRSTYTCRNTNECIYVCIDKKSSFMNFEKERKFVGNGAPMHT